MKLKNNLYTKTGWEIYENELIRDEIINNGSSFMIGNGYLGNRATFAEWSKDEYVATIVTDTYDMADGKWRELCNAPNALYTKLFIDDEEVSQLNKTSEKYSRELNLKYGLLKRNLILKTNKNKNLEVKTERFASFDNIHLINMKYSFRADKKSKIRLLTGIDSEVWNLNGEHFSEYELFTDEGVIGIEVKTVESNIKLDVAEAVNILGKKPLKESIIREKNNILREFIFEVEEDEEITMEKTVSIYSSNDIENPKEYAIKDAKKALENGYQLLLDKHKEKWEQTWNKSDIKIKDNIEDQVILRFNLYHNIIATPTHDYLPIGARGLSCQAYQGAAFWDQEIFNMPMFLYTRPKVARNLLVFRYNTLDGARKKAKDLGYNGAFYPWISGKSGLELCPSYFFTDILTGRKIRNHFNDWQIHISPDIAYAIMNYYKATKDWDFMSNYGLEMLVEISRFLYSYAYFKKDKNRYEFIRLLGPDEYHENVDNNAYTNYMSKYALESTLEVYNKMKDTESDKLNELMKRINLSEEEFESFKEMKELLYIPKVDKDSLLIEQFDGYFDLEDITPEEMEKRIIKPGEYLGWPNGVAVETQVIKQADIIQLFCLHDIFDKDILKSNYDYYEKRTEHGSSLSPSAYSIIAARIGHIDQAYDYFKDSCTIDLYNTNKAISGGTFIGGIHTASCGAAWQMMVYGFSGFRLKEDYIEFSPVIPKFWKGYKFKLNINNNIIEVNIDRENINIKGNNIKDIKIKIYGNIDTLKKGKEINYSLK